MSAASSSSAPFCDRPAASQSCGQPQQAGEVVLVGGLQALGRGRLNTPGLRRDVGLVFVPVRNPVPVGLHHARSSDLNDGTDGETDQ